MDYAIVKVRSSLTVIYIRSITPVKYLFSLYSRHKKGGSFRLPLTVYQSLMAYGSAISKRAPSCIISSEPVSISRLKHSPIKPV